jgi:ribosomal protein S18 acetylase RimI-like enzyme
VRPLAPADLPAARTILAADTSVARFLARAREIVDDAAKGRGEYLALAAPDEGALRGLVLFGDVAGSEGAATIIAVGVAAGARRQGVGGSLVRAACDVMHARGARLVVAELADDPTLDSAHALLTRCGFAEVGRVPDLYSAGVAMRILELRMER